MEDCIICGAPTDSPTSICDLCTRPPVDVKADPEAPETPPERLTDRELLVRIAKLVTKQEADLVKIRFRTGCLFAWLLLSLLLGLMIVFSKSV